MRMISGCLLPIFNKQDWRELIKYAEQWYNWDKSNKIAIEYIIWAASTDNRKQTAGIKYTAIKENYALIFGE